MPQQFAIGGNPQAKSIILFSDGTGNSSAKLFKTNVWRLYEAVDLGPLPPGDERRIQIAYYDNGVGTSTFRPLAVLGGVFGWGLKRNILHIYRYVCRNYQPGQQQGPGDHSDETGDYIYGFGFSRGAFTMRLVISLLATEGVVTYTDERDLARKSADAYRAFCHRANPRFFPFLAIAARVVRQLLITGWRKLWHQDIYDRTKNYRPILKFVGVWDTVAAYGGPFSELTRAIDNWIWPLSMPNYKLTRQVRRARHALAIDDERDAFHPLLWDEVFEQLLIGEDKHKPAADPTKITAERLKQVWFSGMHSDVGGGYPDESLSYISLVWMIREARACGLRTLPELVDRIEKMSNSFGPIHNSRAGLAAYYRYQPRKIASYLEPVDASTLAIRDPAVSGGLMLGVRIHESVVARIASGTDSYAPVNLPRAFEVEPMIRLNDAPMGLVEPRTRRRIGASQAGGPQPTKPQLKRAAARYERQEVIWNWVWLRRVIYYVTLATTFALALMPFWVASAPTAPFFTDSRSWIGSVINSFGAVLPDFTGRWLDTYSRYPFYFLVFVAVVVALLALGTLVERVLRDRIRRLWWIAIDSATKPLSPPARTGWRRLAAAIGAGLRRLRDNIVYQGVWRALKWHLVPNILGSLMLLLLIFGGLATYTQARLTALERGNELCRPVPPAQLQRLVKARIDFATRNLCNATAVTVERGTRYAISFIVTERWVDGAPTRTRPPTTPLGQSARSLATIAAIPLRRVMTAAYLRPLIEIRPPREAQGVFPNVYIFAPDLTENPNERNVYRAEFEAARSGELFLFANDAIMPFEIGEYGRDYFYARSAPADTPGGRIAGGNYGRACVMIEQLEMTDEERLEADKVPACPPPLPVPKRRPGGR